MHHRSLCPCFRLCDDQAVVEGPLYAGSLKNAQSPNQHTDAPRVIIHQTKLEYLTEWDIAHRQSSQAVSRSHQAEYIHTYI